MGSFGAMASIGLIAVIGIMMIMASRNKETGERNTPLFVSGVVLIVSTALPLLPYFGLSLAFDELTQ